jgi:hypothetical protein
MCMCMRLRLWVGVNVNVAMILVVGVEVGVRCRRWLMVRVLIRRLWVVGVVERHGRRRVRLWRREGRTVMSAATSATARCARVMPVLERGCRSGHWVGTRVRGRRWTLLRVGRGRGQDLDMWRRSGREKKGDPYRGKDATEDKTETMYVGIAVSIVLHRGLGGVVGTVVRLVEQRASEETMKGWNGGTDWFDGGSRVKKTMPTIILRR